MWLLWIISLAASFLLPATGKVVDSFTPCKQFFLGGNPPSPTLRPMNPVRICQHYNQHYRFATMYDKDRHIPMYSAYRYQPNGGDRQQDWMIEPQLASYPKDPRYIFRISMEVQATCGIDSNILRTNQAVHQDYREGVQYDRGHLAPVSHQPDQNSKDATFTLTNIVPQFRELNQGQWRIYEENINAAGCRETYVIVGAVPGNTVLPGGRVNIPSHIWAAGCCVLRNNQKRSWAVIAKNNGNTVLHRTLGQLQVQLATLYRKKTIDLFNNACNEPQN